MKVDTVLGIGLPEQRGAKRDRVRAAERSVLGCKRIEPGAVARACEGVSV